LLPYPSGGQQRPTTQRSFTVNEDIMIKRVAINLKQNRKYIEIEVPGEDILASLDPVSPDFENMVKIKVIEYIRSIRS
jgi:hypothetical protein